MAIFDHPMLRPLPMRLLPVIFLVGWAVFEAVFLGGILWPILFIGAAAYCYYVLIHTYTPPADKTSKDA